jgi:hypothetical protein
MYLLAFINVCDRFIRLPAPDRESAPAHSDRHFIVRAGEVVGLVFQVRANKMLDALETLTNAWGYNNLWGPVLTKM